MRKALFVILLIAAFRTLPICPLLFMILAMFAVSCLPVEGDTLRRSYDNRLKGRGQ